MFFYISSNQLYRFRFTCILSIPLKIYSKKLNFKRFPNIFSVGRFFYFCKLIEKYDFLDDLIEI